MSVLRLYFTVETVSSVYTTVPLEVLIREGT
jgi:hypothetical protein